MLQLKKVLKERIKDTSEETKILIKLAVFVPTKELEESKHRYLDIPILSIKSTTRAMAEKMEPQALADFDAFLTRITGFIRYYSEGLYEEERSQQSGLSLNFAFFRKGEEHLLIKDSTVIVIRISTHFKSKEVAQFKDKERAEKFSGVKNIQTRGEPLVIFEKDGTKYKNYREPFEELVQKIKATEQD
jgi:hypothetical protein